MAIGMAMAQKFAEEGGGSPLALAPNRSGARLSLPQGPKPTGARLTKFSRVT
jgi:hypothetical protein